jgi:biopolymer transport protein TolR
MAEQRRKRRLMGEINVVPYIDVMLVLLVIFMVTAPLLTLGVKVQLPRTGAEPLAVRRVQNEPPLVLSIDAQGRWYLNVGRAQERPLDDRTAAARAAAVLRRSPEVQVLVKGDRRVPYGRLLEAMVMLQRVGASRVGFLTDPLPRGTSRPPAT